jgi:hypothetical protein
VIPRQWKVIQHVREKFTCRDCEKISEAPVCLSNNAAERSWLFAGTDRGGRRAAAMYSLIVTCKMNDVDLQA